MKYRKLFTVVLFALLVFQLAPTHAAGRVTVTLQPQGVSLTNRLLVTVPVSVVCDPMSGEPYGSSVSASLQQASGQQISRGNGYISVHPLFICDGVTPNLATVQFVPDATSGPFHGGQAILGVSAGYSVATNCGEYGCYDIQMESGQLGPLSVKVH